MVECSFRPALAPGRIGTGATAMIDRRTWFVFLPPLGLVALLGFALFAQQTSPASQYQGGFSILRLFVRHRRAVDTASPDGVAPAGVAQVCVGGNDLRAARGGRLE